VLEKFFQQKKEPLVGIDISSTSVKVLQLEKIDKQCAIIGYGIEPLPQNAVIEKNIKDVDMVGNTIKKAMERAKLTAKNAAIAVAGTAVITQIIQIDANLTEAEMEDQIFVEADRYIPYSLEEVNLDFEILGPSRNKNPDLVDVLLAAAKHDVVDLRVAAVNAAGLSAKIVDIESLTIERAFGLLANQLPKEEIKENIALIDIGSTATTLHVINNLRSIYSREQAFGGKQLLEEIQRRYGLSLEETASMNIYEGLPDDFAPEVLQPFKESVVQQVNRALQFFFSSGDHQEISYIVLSGGVATLVGLDELVQNKIGKKTFVSNPFSDMVVPSHINQNILLHDAPGLMVCCGLALRTFDT
jgi:type IV pilus assembly protein PilM